MHTAHFLLQQLNDILQTEDEFLAGSGDASFLHLYRITGKTTLIQKEIKSRDQRKFKLQHG